MNDTPERAAAPLLSLSLLGAVVLAFEVFVTKLLAYSMHTMLLYVVLATALLGSGAAGSVVAIRARWLEPDRLPRALHRSALAFTASLVIAPAIFVRVTPTLAFDLSLGTFLAGALLTLPFFAAGVCVTLAFSAAAREVGRAYAANLVGSGLGCFLPLALLGPLDGARFLSLLAVISWVAAFSLLRRSGARSTQLDRLSTWAMLGVVVMLVPLARHAFPIAPEPSGQAELIRAAADAAHITSRRVYDRWNPTGRIEIFEYGNVAGSPSPYPFLFYAQDASAGSLLVKWDGRDEESDVGRPSASQSNVARMCNETIFGQAYFRPRARVLVIGLGGGPDVQCALYHRATSVDAVEINRASIDAVTGPFDEHLGGIGSSKNVAYHARDGRSFAHAHKGAGYDLVQLSGVDTKQLLVSGSLSLSENHLYTREAFDDYLGLLSKDGVVAILRFGEGELFRLARTAVDALRARGALHPEDHMLVIHNGPLQGLIVRREPFDAEELARARAHFDYSRRPFTGIGVFFYEVFSFPLRVAPLLTYSPGSAREPKLAEFFAEVRAGDTRPFESAYELDISPASDDRPFFFDLTRYDRQGAYSRPHVLILGKLVGVTLALSLLAILLPLLWIHARKTGSRSFVGPVLFACTGLGYMLVEAWLLHRFGVFLGHQTYSLSVVLATLLVSTGVGAALGERWRPKPAARVALGAVSILAVLALGFFALPFVLEATWRTSIVVRALVAASYVSLAGLALGLPFPAGLRWLGEKHPDSIPWCVGINSFSSVVAMVMVLPLALRAGYSVVLAVGAVTYAIAFMVSFRMRAAK